MRVNNIFPRNGVRVSPSLNPELDLSLSLTLTITQTLTITPIPERYAIYFNNLATTVPILSGGKGEGQTVVKFYYYYFYYSDCGRQQNQPTKDDGTKSLLR